MTEQEVKLISADISPDPGATFTISSNSAAPLQKLIVPTGNLQTEFLTSLLKTNKQWMKRNHLAPTPPPCTALSP